MSVFVKRVKEYVKVRNVGTFIMAMLISITILVFIASTNAVYVYTRYPLKDYGYNRMQRREIATDTTYYRPMSNSRPTTESSHAYNVQQSSSRGPTNLKEILIYNEVLKNISRVNHVIQDLINNYQKLKTIYKSQESISAEYSSDDEIDEVYKHKNKNKIKRANNGRPKHTEKPGYLATAMFLSNEKSTSSGGNTDSSSENSSTFKKESNGSDTETTKTTLNKIQTHKTEDNNNKNFNSKQNIKEDKLNRVNDYKPDQNKKINNSDKNKSQSSKEHESAEANEKKPPEKNKSNYQNQQKHVYKMSTTKKETFVSSNERTVDMQHLVRPFSENNLKNSTDNTQKQSEKSKSKHVSNMKLIEEKSSNDEDSSNSDGKRSAIAGGITYSNEKGRIFQNSQKNKNIRLISNNFKSKTYILKTQSKQNKYYVRNSSPDMMSSIADSKNRIQRYTTKRKVPMKTQNIKHVINAEKFSENNIWDEVKNKPIDLDVKNKVVFYKEPVLYRGRDISRNNKNDYLANSMPSVPLQKMDDKRSAESIEDEKLIVKEQFKTRILRKAYGDACLKVVVKKCYKACKAAVREVSRRYSCKTKFRTDFQNFAKTSCIREFREVEAGSRNNLTPQALHFQDVTRNGYLAAACLPVTRTEDTQRRALTNVENYTGKNKLNILRDRFERACQQVSATKCTNACKEASKNTCDSNECKGKKLNALKKACKIHCKYSYSNKKPIEKKNKYDKSESSGSDSSDSSSGDSSYSNIDLTIEQKTKDDDSDNSTDTNPETVTDKEVTLPVETTTTQQMSPQAVVEVKSSVVPKLSRMLMHTRG